MRLRSSPRYFFPLFVVSLVSISFEISLTRYFAIAQWSEYGYWVISIAMGGFAASGVVISLFKDFFSRKSAIVLFLVPILLMIAGAVGFFLVTINPFNPLELQNPFLWFDQVINIGKYYLALFPFFFLSGGYIGLIFVVFQQDIPKVYAIDLVGAGFGAMLILGFMFLVNPFQLPAIIILPLALVSLCFIPLEINNRNAYRLMVLIIWLACELLLSSVSQVDYNEFKDISLALNTRGNKVIRTVESPDGYFQVLDNFTERLDVDVSNNLGLIGASEPPQTYGLYRDGNRITSLPKTRNYDDSYVNVSLSSAPYRLLSSPEVALIGSMGQFRIWESLSLGASKVVALEPNPRIFDLVRKHRALGTENTYDQANVELVGMRPAQLESTGKKLDLIDISPDLLDQSYANRYAFTHEAIQSYFQILSDTGIISIPISIREFTVYAVKMLETIRNVLDESGVRNPEKHIIVYRSSWNARILVSKQSFEEQQIQQIVDFCHDLSFDVSYFPGINPEYIEPWNELPSFSFGGDHTASPIRNTRDALMRDALVILSSERGNFLDRHFFDLRPSTHDRPFFYSILRVSNLNQIIKYFALIPRQEIGYLINLAVIFQAILLGFIVLTVPLIRWNKRLPTTITVIKSVLYFACLGLGFLFIEIYLIEKVSFLLNDSTIAFGIVIACMLVFSGLGSLLSGRFLTNPQRAVQIAVLIILLWVALVFQILDNLLFSLMGIHFAIQVLVLVLLIAPVALALGFPFPLGLTSFRGKQSHFLPWAWSLNGAFSVLSPPLAKIIVVSSGYSVLLFAIFITYLIASVVYPTWRANS